MTNEGSQEQGTSTYRPYRTKANMLTAAKDGSSTAPHALTATCSACATRIRTSAPRRAMATT